MKKLLNKFFLFAYGTYFNVSALLNSTSVAKKAFEAFCKPRKGKVLPKQKNYLLDAKDDILSVQQLQLQTYRWCGEKETVLLLHGWESNTFRWRNLVQKLQEEKYNVVAFDAPAHGNSTGLVLNGPLYGASIQAAIEKYQPKYIIGHSFGGMAMIYNEYNFRNAGVEKLISLGAPSELTDFMAQYEAMLGLNSKLMNAMETHFTSIFGMKFADFSTPKFIKSIDKKGLLIHDELDYIAPIKSSVNVHANWKGSIFIKTKGLGHSLHQDGVRNEIVNFLKS